MIDRMPNAPIFCSHCVYLDLLFAFNVTYFVFAAVKRTDGKGAKKIILRGLCITGWRACERREVLLNFTTWFFVAEGDKKRRCAMERVSSPVSGQYGSSGLCTAND